MTRTISETMQAAAIDRFGGVDEIELQTLPVPEVGPDEVLIRVESVGVGAWDPWEREGLFQELFRETYGVEPTFPYVIGFDGAGTVVSVGEAVTRFDEHYLGKLALVTESSRRVPDANDRFTGDPSVLFPAT